MDAWASEEEDIREACLVGGRQEGWDKGLDRWREGGRDAEAKGVTSGGDGGREGGEEEEDRMLG